MSSCRLTPISASQLDNNRLHSNYFSPLGFRSCFVLSASSINYHLFFDRFASSSVFWQDVMLHEVSPATTCAIGVEPTHVYHIGSTWCISDLQTLPVEDRDTNSDKSSGNLMLEAFDVHIAFSSMQQSIIVAPLTGLLSRHPLNVNGIATVVANSKRVTNLMAGNGACRQLLMSTEVPTSYCLLWSQPERWMQKLRLRSRRMGLSEEAFVSD
ncbi:hypothetical protein AKJ16_DCAP24584 [Drosera capensis]